MGEKLYFLQDKFIVYSLQLQKRERESARMESCKEKLVCVLFCCGVMVDASCCSVGPVLQRTQPPDVQLHLTISPIRTET